MEKQRKHYVDNKMFHAKMIEYKQAVEDAVANNQERPRVSEYIGTCLFKIATHLARKPNFSNYTFREDMVSDGVENCLLYIDNFDPAKSDNPFSYFTQIIYYAFLRRIQKEKKNLYIKYKSMENEIITTLVDNSGGSDNILTNLNDMMHDSYSEQFISDFIKTFEEGKKKKKAESKKKTASGVIKFIEEEENADADSSTVTRMDQLSDEQEISDTVEGK